MSLLDPPATIASIEDGRARLDAIDEQIRDLVRSRREVSQQVQQLRRSAGGPRIEHARENEIVSRYGNAYGRPGVALALSVLEICRGQTS